MDSLKAYTVTEINHLRQACENRYLWGSYSPRMGGGMSRSYREDEKVKCVEEAVRTHMMAGHTAEDLYASERKAHG